MLSRYRFGCDVRAAVSPYKGPPPVDPVSSLSYVIFVLPSPLCRGGRRHTALKGSTASIGPGGTQDGPVLAAFGFARLAVSHRSF
jgi:hypothetical protein